MDVLLHRTGALVAIAWLVACGGSNEEDEVEAPPPEAVACAVGDTTGPTGTCCPPATLPEEDGSCRPAGIAACGEGFVATEGGGCEPVLPATPCAPGLMAVPGEGACRAIMDCGSGPWGNIEVDGNTEYVDARYDGGASDGSAARPWTRIKAGIDAATPGAVVAVAAGVYGEDVGVDKAVRVRGRCPYLVTVVGQGLSNAIGIYASGAEIGGLAITGPAMGVSVSGASDVKLDRIWVHDTGSRGMELDGPAAATLTGSLVENTHEVGVIAFSADVAFEMSVVRDIQVGDGYGVGVWQTRVAGSSTPSRATVHRSLIERTLGQGLIVQESSLTMQSSVVRDVAPKHTINIYGRGIEVARSSDLVLTQSLIERTHDDGVIVSSGARASIENTFFRDIEPQVSDGLSGAGVAVQSDMAGNRSSATVKACLFERTHLAAMLAFGSDLDAESVIARDTLPGLAPLGPDAKTGFGAGLVLQDDPNHLRARGSLRGALVENSSVQSVVVLGADLRLEATKVVGGIPADDGFQGQGLVVRNDIFTQERGFAELFGCAFEANHSAGVIVHESDAVLDNVAIRDTRARVSDGKEGYGITVQRVDPAHAPSQVTVRRSLVERASGIGVFVYSSHAVLESSLVRDTSAEMNSGLYGDGVAAAEGTVDIRGAVIERSARAGVASFGAAVTVGGSTFECNSIQLAMQSFVMLPASFTDGGGNHCGCGDAQGTCKTLSSSLEPPTPVD